MQVSIAPFSHNSRRSNKECNSAHNRQERLVPKRKDSCTAEQFDYHSRCQGCVLGTMATLDAQI